VRRQIAELATWDGSAATAPAVPAAEPPDVGPGQAVLASWRLLLDAGRLQDGEPWLAGTARRPVARLSQATADEVGVSDGEPLTVSTASGSLTLPVLVTELPERVVWLPTNQVGAPVREILHADAGSVVQLSRGGVA
jgi:NADH-quinone oxidoreductase subunit G